MGCWAGAVPIIFCQRGAPIDTSRRLCESFVVASSEGADRCEIALRFCFCYRPLRCVVYAVNAAVVRMNYVVVLL